MEGPVIVDEPEVLVRAAMDGAGIAYLFEQQVAAGLADGRLLPLLDAWTPPFPVSICTIRQTAKCRARCVLLSTSPVNRQSRAHNAIFE